MEQKEIPQMRWFVGWFLVLVTGMTAVPADAQPLVIGRSLPLTGQLKALGEYKRDGGDAYIRKVNSSGGIGGRPIELVTLDDGYDASATVENMRKISAEYRPIAFLGLLRLPTVGDAVPLLEELKIPAVGVSSATDALRAKFNPYGFPVRASFGDEARILVNHVKVIGSHNVSVVYQSVPLGLNLKNLTETALKDGGIPFTTLSLDATASNTADIVGQLVRQEPQVVFLGVLTPTAVTLIAQLKKAAFGGVIYTYSSTDVSVIARHLGKQAAGLAMSQVVPVSKGARVKIVAEYLQALAALGQGSPSLLGLEGYIEAKVLVEGLRRAGPNPTTVSLAKGLETLRDWDVGGFFVSYSPSAHTGSFFVEVSMLGSTGELIR